MEKSNFIDYIRVFCHSGHGGAGSRHFMRNKLTAKGGPDGGDGGRGGHIILRGNKQLWTLLHLRYYKNVIAENGENGSKNNSTGHDGADIYIDVPLGTVARDEETGKLEAEILEDGQEHIWLAVAVVAGRATAILPHLPTRLPTMRNPAKKAAKAGKYWS